MRITDVTIRYTVEVDDSDGYDEADMMHNADEIRMWVGKNIHDKGYVTDSLHVTVKPAEADILL